MPDHSEEAGALRFRQIEYYRMPMMAWLALDEPRDLTRNDFIRLGLVTGAGGGDNAAPYAEKHLADMHRALAELGRISERRRGLEQKQKRWSRVERDFQRLEVEDALSELKRKMGKSSDD